MRRSIPLLRGAKGYNWYNRFIKEGAGGFSKHTPPTPFDWDVCGVKRPRVFFDFGIDNEYIGKVTFELAIDVVKETVENFIELSSGNNKFVYKGTKIHDIRKGVSIMGGDVENKNGQGGHSSKTERFLKDENFIIPHSSKGLISMASVGVHTNNSQFYISLAPMPQLNGRCVVFGRIISGDDILQRIEDSFTVRGMPVRDVLVMDCGLVTDTDEVLQNAA